MSNNIASDYGSKDKTLFTYSLGIVLCVILTLIPFFAVKNPSFFNGYNVLIIYGCAVLQFFVQIIFFLRLNYSTYQAKLNVLSFVYCIIILFILVFGSIWIMWNLNYNMMH